MHPRHTWKQAGMVAGDAVQQRLRQAFWNGLRLCRPKLVELQENLAALFRGDEAHLEAHGSLVAALPRKHKVDRGQHVPLVHLVHERCKLRLLLLGVMVLQTSKGSDTFLNVCYEER